ncbi:MAG: ribosome recycling factor [Rikenellaceae bacterium]|nr:ribosome recycling factor [Rikenellaceae bacterium]
MSDESVLIIDAAEEKMSKAIAHLDDALLSVRAGKASTHVLRGIMVEYYGAPTPIEQVASVTVPDAKTILVQPWERNMIAPIEKAILVSNIGLTPSNNGEHIRLNIPALTEERRKELVKQVRTYKETAKVSLRNARRDAVDAFKKAQKNGMPEDEAKDGENEAQKLIDRYTKKLDEMVAAKEKEIMTV